MENMTLWIKRLVMFAISLALGYGATYVIVVYVVQTTIQEYMWGPEHPIPLPYFFLTGLFMALGIAIWLDKFMETDILKH
ncbi:MAG TPA: hypothetical protein VLL52_02455 [Anaerolineae bacterium]|nr:hypothetical protein [Anaerolineae bacterium]